MLKQTLLYYHVLISSLPDKGRQRNCNLFRIKWPDQIRCLGIYVGHEINKNFNSNWNNKIDKIKVILKRWKERDLSLFGKVHVVKTFAISQFVLPA